MVNKQEYEHKIVLGFSSHQQQGSEIQKNSVSKFQDTKNISNKCSPKLLLSFKSCTIELNAIGIKLARLIFEQF